MPKNQLQKLLKRIDEEYAIQHKSIPAASDGNGKAEQKIKGDRLGPDQYIKEAMMQATSYVDEQTYTPTRIIHVFFPEVFNSAFIDYRGNLVVFSMAILLAIFGYHSRISELKDEARENRDDSYILRSLAREKKKNHPKAQPSILLPLPKDGIQIELNGIQTELNAIAQELFPGTCVELTGDTWDSVHFTLKKTKVVPETKPQTSFYKVSIAIGYIWSLLSDYAMFYWIVWMTAILIAGIALTPALGFGLPAIAPALYILWKVTDWVYRKKVLKERSKTADEIDTQFNKLLIFRAYADKLMLDALKCSEEKKAVDKKIALQPEQELEPEKKLFPSLFKNKALVITMAIAAALVSGYNIAVFIQWPITDLLIKVFHVSAVGTATALSPATVFITFSIALAIGLFFAIKKGIQTGESIEKSRIIAINAKQAVAETLALKLRYQANKNAFNQAFSKMPVDSKDYNFWKEIANNLPELAIKGDRHWLSILCSYIAMWISGAGSGVFVIRTVLLAGCIIPLLMGPFSWGLSFGISMVAGFIWGCFKLMEMVHKREEARNLKMLKELPHLKWLYKQYNALLEQVLDSVALAQPAAVIANTDSIAAAVLSQRAALSPVVMGPESTSNTTVVPEPPHTAVNI